MTLHLDKIRMFSEKAAVPRKSCQGDTCSCGDYPKRMTIFHKEVTPEVVIMLVECIQSFTDSGFERGINWLWCERDRLMRKTGERK